MPAFLMTPWKCSLSQPSFLSLEQETDTEKEKEKEKECSMLYAEKSRTSPELCRTAEDLDQG